jgi:hypothetical protein
MREEDSRSLHRLQTLAQGCRRMRDPLAVTGLLGRPCLARCWQSQSIGIPPT